MTISLKRFRKDDLTMNLRYGFGGGEYWIALDGVVLVQTPMWRPAWDRGQRAEREIVAAGWEKI